MEIILEQRQLEKLRGTYVDALPTLINPDTGRVHTSYNQTGAVTGRISSSNPNLQNIPIRTEVGRQIRRAFIAQPGWTLASADYSQVELRVLAHVAGEEALIAAFQADQDIHAATAARLFDVPIEEVDRDQRGLAKTINFATIYGVSEFGLSSRTDMSREEARHFLEQYFLTYPRIKEYIAETIQKANEEGYVETLLGRKRMFPELRDTTPALQPAAGRRARRHQRADSRHGCRHHEDRHDQPAREAEGRGYRIAHAAAGARRAGRGDAGGRSRRRCAALIREVMETAYELVVPLKVDVEVGPNWYEMQPV